MATVTSRVGLRSRSDRTPQLVPLAVDFHEGLVLVPLFTQKRMKFRTRFLRISDASKWLNLVHQNRMIRG
jgi:hypothetical protein